MEKSYQHMVSLYTSVRDGKINNGLLDGIWVECYNSKTLLRHLGLVTTYNQSLLIEPYDTSILVNIETAIRRSDLGLKPQRAKSSILVHIPRLHDDQKKSLIKYAKRIAEDTKISIRNLRRKARKEQVLSSKRIDELTAHYVSLIDQRFNEKKALIQGTI